MNYNDLFSFDVLYDLYQNNLQNSRAKGIDKLNSNSFEKKKIDHLRIIERKCQDGSYNFTPYLEVLKLKGRDSNPRTISIPTIRDRIVLLALKDYLHEHYSHIINRKKPNGYIHDIKKFLFDNIGTKYFLKLDIKKFYDTIDRNLLLTKLRKDKVDDRIIYLINSAINTPTIPVNSKKENYEYFKAAKGVPQGLSISNILAQVYLAELDEVLDKRKYFYRRYVDDIMIMNIGEISKFRYENLNKEIQGLGLEFNENKKEEGLVENSFTFLGYQISNSKISIAEKNVERYIRRIAGKFTWYKNGLSRKTTRPTWLMENDSRFKEVFIEELNESITGIISMDKNYGWLFYFSEMTDLSLLFKIDKIISGFFTSIDTFDNTVPDNLKTLVRTFHLIKHRTKNNYIANYDLYDTIRKKRSFLEFRGFIDPENEYPDWQIENFFTKYRNKQIKHVEQDIGYAYI